MADMVTLKASKDALKLLRLVAALTGEKQYAVLDRLLEAEVERLSPRRKGPT